MTLFILTETSAGYALLKSKDKKLLKRDDLAEETNTAEGVCSLYVLHFDSRFSKSLLHSFSTQLLVLVEPKLTFVLST